MNIHNQQSAAGNADARYLLNVKHNVVTGSTNQAVFGGIQDTMCAVRLLTQMDIPFEVLLDISVIQKYNYKEIYELVPEPEEGLMVPGRYALDLLFPREFHYHEAGVTIVNGRITEDSVPMGKKHAGAGCKSINFYMALDYGNDASINWLSDVGRTYSPLLHSHILHSTPKHPS